ncbi:uncharacterized protein LOC125676611 [Ostrea edulis]|uniref:uncharacterized protein LOC125676611 n=1 Tax=Ostrea edulis TaxID=37623 RepID=UPI0024AE8ADD|nr:uncharacterized protein LOC125676611 [Ostrea edulis]
MSTIVIVSTIPKSKVLNNEEHLRVDTPRHVVRDKRIVKYGFTGCYTITEDGNLLFIDGDDEVRKLTSVDTTLFTPDRRALCIHSSRINGDILVGSYEKVTKYDRTGRNPRVIKKDDKGQSLYGVPAYITENKTGYIWTSEWRTKAVLVVVDKSGRRRFNYKGRPYDHSGHQPVFYPTGICTDVHGHVLVCGYNNSSIHFPDQDGQFLSLLLTQDQHGMRVWTTNTISICERRTVAADTYCSKIGFKDEINLEDISLNQPDSLPRDCNSYAVFDLETTGLGL